MGEGTGLLMGFLTVNQGFNQGSNISPRRKFLDELAISESLFSTVL